MLRAAQRHLLGEFKYFWFINLTIGLYYKHTMIVNYASGAVNELEALLADDARVVI